MFKSIASILALSRFVPDSDGLQEKFVQADNPILTPQETEAVNGALAAQDEMVQSNRNSAHLESASYFNSLIVGASE